MTLAPLLLRHEAQAGFEAARRVDGGPLHGHSFLAQVRTPVGSSRAGLGGLERRLAALVARWDGGCLNDALEDAGDAALAAHIALELSEPHPEVAPEQVLLHAGPRRGALWTAGAHAHWRRYGFEAAHWLPHVPEGHKCGRLHGHGFGVLLHADAPHEAIDAAWAPQQFVLQRRCLNRIEGLANPTSEVLAAWIWQRLADSLAGLQRVSVFETGSSGAAFDGQRHSIWKQCSLDSAVAEGDELLGHTYALRLHLSAPLDEVLGWVVDFGDVKSRFAPVFEALDHQPLHERLRGDAMDCASLARWIFEQASERLPELDRVDLHQTPGCGTVVAREARALHAGP